MPPALQRRHVQSDREQKQCDEEDCERRTGITRVGRVRAKDNRRRQGCEHNILPSVEAPCTGETLDPGDYPDGHQEYRVVGDRLPG